MEFFESLWADFELLQGSFLGGVGRRSRVVGGTVVCREGFQYDSFSF